jgi:hypothetical protein
MKPLVSKFCLVSCAVAIAGLTSSCVQQYPQQTEAETIIKRMEQHFADMENPLAAVNKVRKFAYEKLSDMTDAEEKTIRDTDPEIATNFEGTEYSFTWKTGKDKQKIEVITTPPPCEPIEVYRVNRVFYP